MASAQKRAFLGLGSNIGNRAENIYRGLEIVQEKGAFSVRGMSPLYETEPVGWEGAPWYLNGIAEGDTSLSPRELLVALKQIERDLGRSDDRRNSPRPLDLDILWMEGILIRTPDLAIPHPRLQEREFVLRPLADLAPDLEVEPGLRVRDALEAVKGKEQVRLWAASAGRKINAAL